MSYPAGWDLVTVTGTYIGKNGVPCAGSVTFSSPQLVLRSGTVVPAADIVFDLNSSGAFSGQVPATDDPNAQPTGWLYTVTENVPGGRQGLLIAAPNASPGIDMSTVVPVTMPVPPSYPYPLATLQQLASEVAPTGASLIGFLQVGTGAVGRTLQNKVQERVCLNDFGATGFTAMTAAVDAIQAIGGGTLRMPNGTQNTPVPGNYWGGTLQPGNIGGVLVDYDGPYVPVAMFLEQYGTSYYSEKVYRFYENQAHAGYGHSVVHIENEAYGTGAIGPTNADFALTINLRKQGAGSGSAVAGELDGAYIGVRNDGSNSDTTGFLIDVGQYGTGFNAAFEANIESFVSGSVALQMDVQCGVIDTRTNNQYGLVLNAEKGTLGYGILLQSVSGANWTNFIVGSYNQKNVYQLSASGETYITSTDGTHNVSFGIDPSSYVYYINVASNTSRIVSLDHSGNLSLAGWLNVGGTEILGAVATTATAGTATLPSNPVGFMTISNGGTTYKIPYYHT
jgi:hypothetical protein